MSIPSEVSLQLPSIMNLTFYFAAGFQHANNLNQLDYKSVRLCFQVFIERSDGSKSPLAPVVSVPIYDQKAVRELCITKLSHPSACVMGGQKMILLCKKVSINYYPGSSNLHCYELDKRSL